MTFHRPPPSIVAFAMAMLLLNFFGCRSNAPQSDLPTVQMQIGNKTFTLEVAATETARGRGLMRRDSMPANHGMIFVFADERPLAFYMKNTRIPLDIIYVNADEVVVSIRQMKPYDVTSVPSDAPAKWAIELNQGVAAAVGVKVGDRLKIPEGARTALE